MRFLTCGRGSARAPATSDAVCFRMLGSGSDGHIFALANQWVKGLDNTRVALSSGLSVLSCQEVAPRDSPLAEPMSAEICRCTRRRSRTTGASTSSRRCPSTRTAPWRSPAPSSRPTPDPASSSSCSRRVPRLEEAPFRKSSVNHARQSISIQYPRETIASSAPHPGNGPMQELAGRVSCCRILPRSAPDGRLQCPAALTAPRR